MALLPKPEWLCNQGKRTDTRLIMYLQKERHNEIGTDFDEIRIDKENVDEENANSFIDSENQAVLSMFPIYKGFHTDETEEFSRPLIGEYPNDEPRVDVFHLKNFNFRNFGRVWSNYDQQHYVKHENNKEYSSKEETSIYSFSANDNDTDTDGSNNFFSDSAKHDKKVKMGVPLAALGIDCVRLATPEGAWRPAWQCLHPRSADNHISRFVML